MPYPLDIAPYMKAKVARGEPVYLRDDAALQAFFDDIKVRGRRSGGL